MLSSSAIIARYSLPPRSRTKQWTCNRLGLLKGRYSISVDIEIFHVQQQSVMQMKKFST